MSRLGVTIFRFVTVSGRRSTSSSTTAGEHSSWDRWPGGGVMAKPAGASVHHWACRPVGFLTPQGPHPISHCGRRSDGLGCMHKGKIGSRRGDHSFSFPPPAPGRAGRRIFALVVSRWSDLSASSMLAAQIMIAWGDHWNAFDSYRTTHWRHSPMQSTHTARLSITSGLSLLGLAWERTHRSIQSCC